MEKRVWNERALRCTTDAELKLWKRRDVQDRLRRMKYDKDKVDEMVLALLYLTLHDGDRAWKGHDWDALNRLHEKGMIGDPVGKTKSVWLTEDGLRRSRELFTQHFKGEAHTTT